MCMCRSELERQQLLLSMPSGICQGHSWQHLNERCVAGRCIHLPLSLPQGQLVKCADSLPARPRRDWRRGDGVLGVRAHPRHESQPGTLREPLGAQSCAHPAARLLGRGQIKGTLASVPASLAVQRMAPAHQRCPQEERGRELGLGSSPSPSPSPSLPPPLSPSPLSLSFFSPSPHLLLLSLCLSLSSVPLPPPLSLSLSMSPSPCLPLLSLSRPLPHLLRPLPLPPQLGERVSPTPPPAHPWLPPRPATLQPWPGPGPRPPHPPRPRPPAGSPDRPAARARARARAGAAWTCSTTTAAPTAAPPGPPPAPLPQVLHPPPSLCSHLGAPGCCRTGADAPGCRTWKQFSCPVTSVAVASTAGTLPLWRAGCHVHLNINLPASRLALVADAEGLAAAGEDDGDSGSQDSYFRGSDPGRCAAAGCPLRGLRMLARECRH